MSDHFNQTSDKFEKPPFDAINSAVVTPLGKLIVRGPVTPEFLGSLKLSEGLTCFRPPRRQHAALVELADEPDGLIFTATLVDTVLSYVAFQKPDFPWWKRRCFPSLLELGSIETDPGWRKMGLAKTLFDKLFKNPEFTYFEDFIIIAIQFIESWDLINTGYSPWNYRQFMINFFKGYGFTTWETIDPEIREHPCNILVARIGKNTGVNDIKHFANCCLGTNES